MKIENIFKFFKFILLSFIILMIISILSNVVKLNNKKEINNIKFETNISINRKQTILDIQRNIPEEVLNCVLSEYSITLTNTPIEDVIKQKYNIDIEYATGITLHDKRDIYVNARHPKSFVHEIGHAYSNLKGNIHLNNKWQDLYNIEKIKYQETYADKYISKNPSEFFAGMFAEYCLDGENLKDKSPSIYNFLENLL